MSHIYRGFGIFLISYLLTGVLVRLLEKRAIFDYPNIRSSHSRPIPRGGGLVIVILTLAFLIITQLRDSVLDWPGFFAYVSGAILIAVISWWDDLKSLSPLFRFAVHGLCAGLVVVGVGYWQVLEVPVLGHLEMGWVGILVSFFWVLGLTNAYNFMDGIDGMAGGQGIVSGLGWFVIGWMVDQPIVMILGQLVAASSFGFVLHNWYPAKIFMGDVGSVFLGFTFAVLPLMVKDNPYLPVLGLIMIWPFVFDTAYTFLNRLLKKEAVFLPHRSHLYQRLVISGLSHQVVSTLYMGLSLIGLICAIALLRSWPSWPVAKYATVLSVLVLSICLAVWTLWRERLLST